MNSIGNYNVGSNIRLIVINNGCGTEFKNYMHIAAKLGKEADRNIAAQGHYGNKSSNLLKHYAEDLGFLYLTASTKEEYEKIIPIIIDEKQKEKSILVEVFTESEKESEALEQINTLTKYERKIEELETHKKIPERIKKKTYKEIILWGAGNGLEKNIVSIQGKCKVQYICDNKSELWGKELVNGIKCISPEEITKVQDVFVVITVENSNTAFKIAGELLDMGIVDFDYIYNWLEYADEMKFEGTN